MDISSIWHWLLALPAVALAFLGIQTASPTNPEHRTPNRIVVTSPRPGTPLPRPTSTPVPNRPTPTRPPAATTAPGPTTGFGKAELASEAVCPGQADIAKTTTVLTCLTANARVFHGLAPVSANPALMAAASAKNQDMKQCGYGHTACGRTFSYWITAKGFGGKCYGENIAQGQRTPRDVFVAWMNSSGHRANILNADYRSIGVAELAGPRGPLWSMDLGGC